MGSIHAIITSKNYKSAIIKTIKAGGCNCSRANFVGAYFAALKQIVFQATGLEELYQQKIF